MRRPTSVWIVLLGGFIILPPGNYPVQGHAAQFPYWIIGGALPSEVWLSKGWTAPMIALIPAVINGAGRWKKFRPDWSDFALMVFCLWPALQAALASVPAPPGWASTPFLLGTWALPWLLGRLFLRSRQEALEFAGVLAGMTLALLPIALLEGIFPDRIYTALYTTHPFAFDGVSRYIGYRPQALFEHGNQYGIWCACSALAGFWRWQTAERGDGRANLRAASAAILAGMTLASQSVGAIVIMLAGLTLLSIPRGIA